MEFLDTADCFVDDLLDFALEEEDDDEEHNHHTKKPRKALASLDPNGPFNILGQEDGLNCSLPEFVEEELEWISNKDAFPMLETCFDFPLEHSGSTTLKHHSPVSVLDSNTTSNKKKTGKFTNDSIITSYCGTLRVPGKARSKRQLKCCRDLQDQRFWWSKENFTVLRPAEKAEPVEKVAKIGRKCQHCGSDKTPQWRAGPLGPKTLCNACGVRFKSGRLVPEYRPASSPTFSSVLHSNSHRKVVEMRKQKEMMSLAVVKPEEKGWVGCR